jgi:hypothetical protein
MSKNDGFGSGGISRRQALMGGAAVAGAAWAAPAMTTIDRAYAAGSTKPCTCERATAYGLSIPALPVIGPVGPFPPAPGTTNEVCDPISIGSPPIETGTACAEALGCTADGSVNLTSVGNGLPITVSATVLKGSIAAGATCCQPALSSTIVDLVVNGISVDGNAAPNTDVTAALGLPPDLATVIINEQTCNGGVFTVNALHITLLKATQVLEFELIAGHAQLAVSGCTCPP